MALDIKYLSEIVLAKEGEDYLQFSSPDVAYTLFKILRTAYMDGYAPVVRPYAWDILTNSPYVAGDNPSLKTDPRIKRVNDIYYKGISASSIEITHRLRNLIYLPKDNPPYGTYMYNCGGNDNAGLTGYVKMSDNTFGDGTNKPGLCIEPPKCYTDDIIYGTTLDICNLRLYVRRMDCSLTLAESNDLAKKFVENYESSLVGRRYTPMPIAVDNSMNTYVTFPIKLGTDKLYVNLMNGFTMEMFRDISRRIIEKLTDVKKEVPAWLNECL